MLAMLPLSQDHRMPAQSWSPRRRPVAAETATTEEVDETPESVDAVATETATTEEVDETPESVDAVATETATTEEVDETPESVDAVALEHDSEDSAGIEKEDQKLSEAVSDENEKV